MDYDHLKAGVKEIAEIAASAPEAFRQKCFELLLTTLLQQETGASNGEKKTNITAAPGGSQDDNKKNRGGVTSTTIPMTTQLRLLMKKTEITADDLDKVLLYDNGDVHFVKEPHDTGISTGQMEWALLLALKNAIVKDSMSTDPEDVRSVCQAKGFYDKANFAATFKKPKSAVLFKAALVPQGPAEPLSGDGQDALGNLIKRLAGETK
jgi:hypothetical protein